jgi:hypothetical protein
MQYRIKQVGNWYYPQYKQLWFWLTIQEERIAHNGMSEMLDAGCLSLDSAKCKITEYKKSLEKEKVVIRIWEINE